MTVAELIEELAKMPQDLVELDNYPKGNFFAI